MAQTTAQINKANGSLAIETTRYKSLRSTIKQNGEALTEMGNKLDNALQEEAFPPVESKMTKFKNKVKKSRQRVCNRRQQDGCCIRGYR